MKIMTCSHCGKQYQLGYTGIDGSCDKCAGVERDACGYAWMPGEAQQEYEEVGSHRRFVVNREDAFRA
jgi:hypothetical protein